MQVMTLIALGLAPILGSFGGVLADRIPKGEQVVAGRSRCRGCGKVLRPWEMVPLLSFVMLRGRCSSCGARIPRSAFLMEGGSLLLALHAATVLEGPLLFASIGLGVTLLVITLIDLEAMIIPNSLNALLVVAGLGLAAAAGQERFLLHLLAAGLGYGAFAGLAWLYRRMRGQDGLGLGDAKLLAAAGAWVGPLGLPSIVLLASLGGLATVGLLRLKGVKLKGTDALPFGPFLALAIWLVWLYGPLGVSPPPLSSAL